jgi:hypothetical protein
MGMGVVEVISFFPSVAAIPHTIIGSIANIPVILFRATAETIIVYI